MKNLGVLALFVASLLAVGGALKAQANQMPRIEPGLSRPVALEVAGRGKPRPDGGTHDEEELTAPADTLQALELVDPGGLDEMMRLRLAANAAAGRR